MSIETIELPRRFPVGTRYIVEGKPDKKGKFRITLRCLIFPNGRQVHLPSPATLTQKTLASHQKAPALKSRTSRRRARKR